MIIVVGIVVNIIISYDYIIFCFRLSALLFSVLVTPMMLKRAWDWIWGAPTTQNQRTGQSICSLVCNHETVSITVIELLNMF